MADSTTTTTTPQNQKQLPNVSASGGSNIGQTAPFAVETITNPQEMAAASEYQNGNVPPGFQAYPQQQSQLAGDLAAGAGPNLFTQFGTPIKQTPYNPGDEWQYLSMGPQQTNALIEQLVASGYLSRTEAISSGGTWTTKVADAMKRAQEDANRYQAHVGDFMNWQASGGASGPGIESDAVFNDLLGKTTKQKSPGTALEKMKSTADVAQGIYDAMLNLTGNYATDAETKNFESWYQNQELAARKNYLARGGMNSGTYYSPPTVGAAASQYVLTHDAAQVQGFATASRMIEFYKLMGVNI